MASGLPRTWEEIAAGLIAQETLDLGWWVATVIDRKDDTFTLRFAACCPNSSGSRSGALDPTHLQRGQDMGAI